MTQMSPLRRRMIEDMTVRNLSPATQRSYISAVSKFSRYFGRSPDKLELEDVRAFQVHLVSTGISWPALNQIVCALRFFYGVTLGEAVIPERIPYAREPSKLPTVLSPDEVVQFLEAVSSLKSRVALTCAYAAGLRASEVAGLRIADIDSARGVILVRHGNPRRLGASIGGLAVLHTWGQALTHHPHVHCVVPGGGLSSDGARWVAARPNFFLAVKPLSRLFRRLFLERLQAAFEAGALGFFNKLTHLADRDAFTALVHAMRRIDWVVYAKKPFGGPAQVLAYLGRYTHRVAIANSRLVALDDDHVSFTWKDYRQSGAEKIMRLEPGEFIRRFLLHTLPDGFHRIRYFGFMANGCRAEKIASCRALLVDEKAKGENASSSANLVAEGDNSDAKRVCPDCGGAMRVVERMFPASSRRHAPTSPFRCDTS